MILLFTVAGRVAGMPLHFDELFLASITDTFCRQPSPVSLTIEQPRLVDEPHFHIFDAEKAQAVARRAAGWRHERVESPYTAYFIAQLAGRPFL